MKILKSIFGGRKQPSGDLPPEIARIFEKMAKFMMDEEFQNSMIPPEMRSQIVDGLDVDQLPDGVGEFGRSGENPIPVNGAIGQMTYLSLLKTDDTDQRLLFHRLGAVQKIDVYEIVSIDGRKWDIFFLSPYHPRKSRKAPAGYTLTDLGNQPLLYGTNRRVDGFPYGLQNAIRNLTQEMMGIPLPPPEVREAEEKVRFERPREHEERVEAIMAQVQTYRQ